MYSLENKYFWTFNTSLVQIFQLWIVLIATHQPTKCVPLFLNWKYRPQNPRKETFVLAFFKLSLLILYGQLGEGGILLSFHKTTKTDTTEQFVPPIGFHIPWNLAVTTGRRFISKEIGKLSQNNQKLDSPA